MSDDLVPIPKEFWGNFGEDFVQEAVNPDNPLERRRLYADGRQTYENWLTGDFAVWHPNGDNQQVGGVMLNRAEVEKVFPRDSSSGPQGGDNSLAPGEAPQSGLSASEGIAQTPPHPHSRET